ncbi:MAG: hypothetical protein RL329_2245 [Bacteroidota bacterium]|jgi:hypothetical protein
MKYPEFKDAALRHMESCEYIMNAFASTKSEESKKMILLNTYYLSGYVIECSLKYAFLKIIGYSKAADITSLNYNAYTYKKYISSHDLNRLKAGLEDVGSADLSHGIPYITESAIDEFHKDLLTMWSSEIRYSLSFAKDKEDLTKKLELEPDIIESYLKDVVKPIFEKLTQM